MTWKLHQTEKSTTAQVMNVYTLTNGNKNAKMNKIELGKKLVKLGLKPTRITSTASYNKVKLKGAKKNKVVIFRPTKWNITLPIGQIITEETVTQLN